MTHMECLLAPYHSWTAVQFQHQVRPNESANVAQPPYPWINCTDGHISPTVAKHLVKENIVTGLNLDMSSESMFCMAYAKVKPT